MNSESPIIPAHRLQASKLKGSLLDFTKFFFKYITGRDFVVSQPPGRESHHVIICREFTSLFRNPEASVGLSINVPPGHGKSTLCSMFVAWCYAHYPDCNFLYVSYSHDLAAKHTAFIKTIMSSEVYKHLFDVHIKQDSRAKDHFVTTQGGTIAAFGAQGSITGRDAGLPGLDRFSGAAIIDDPIKPDAAHSQTIRETVIKNYQETIMQRPRDVNVPIISICQRLHEEDLPAYLYSGKDVRAWKKVILKGIDEAGNALYPEVQPIDYLRELQEKQPYVFSSQIQQDPIPAGGALFKEQDFVVLDEEPEILETFIVCDTAETDKTYNDASAFSFFGVYEIEAFGRKTGVYGLHWIDALEVRVEPKYLQDTFLDFYAECSRHKKPPLVAYIEKKSTGTTLISTMQDMRSLQIRNIERSRASGSKTTRFLQLQPYIASKYVSFTKGARHNDLCINHMIKITANDTHRFDDMCDTLADGVRLALVEKVIYNISKDDTASNVVKNMSDSFKRKHGALRNARGSQKIF